MTSLLYSFVPYHVLADLAAHPDASPVGREQRFEAVVLFADVSGFTSISEALATTGKSGAEELTRILNSYFEPMIALIQSYGGIIGKFGGDAMTVLFPCPETAAGRVATVRRALQCALAMQERMGKYAAIPTSVGTFSLAMKAGLAGGQVFCTTVGHPQTRLEYIIAGSALDRCAEAEHHASRGEVVAETALLTDLPEVVIGEQRDAFSLVRALLSPAPPEPLAPLDVSTIPAETIIPYIHPTLAHLIQEGQISFINGHRKVTVGFVSFAGFDYDHDPQIGARLQAYLAEVIAIVKRYDGYLNKVDMGDKGSKYIVLFGAPVAHEDDADRALRCLLELRALPRVPLRAGVNTGFVFCGQVGAPARQEYTVMGDAVNLAARLMQAARPGEILVGAGTRLAAHQDHFLWEARDPLQVKGKAEPVKLCALQGLATQNRLHLQEPRYALPMVGRQLELQRARGLLQQARAGRGQVLGISAEAGMGKSRLAAEVIRQGLAEGFTVYGGECLSHGTAISYLVWRHLLRGLFDLDPTWSLEVQREHLEAHLAALDPDLVARAPLLGSALDLPLPDNQLTRSLDPKLRKASLEALVVQVLRHEARQRPLLLVLEDCHWIDPLSNDLLEAVARACADVPVFLLVVYRPPEGPGAIYPRVTHLAHFTAIELREFTAEEAAELIALKLAQLTGQAQTLPPALVERITARAQGNPFYIDEMINLIRDRGLDVADEQALAQIELPDSLHSLILSRIDQLPEQAQTTLKVASVIGRLFRAAWLIGVYPPLGTLPQVLEQLELLSRLDITPLDKPEPELEYLFKHIITREVAYESLALATRTYLHEQLGHFIEAAYPDQLDQFLDLLAYHYGLSENRAKQREYFRRAGDAARAAYANEAAIMYYRRLLPLLDAGEQPPVLLYLGEVLQLTGAWDEAEAVYREALRLAREQRHGPLMAHALRLIGSLLRQKGQFEEALAHLEEAERYEDLSDWGAMSETLREIGIVYWNLGDLQGALANFNQVLNLAEKMGNVLTLCRVANNLGLTYKRLGDHERALEFYQRGYTLAKEKGEQVVLTSILLNMGNVYLDAGDYSAALESYTQALLTAQRLGYQLAVNISAGNMGHIYRDLGAFEAARACYGYSLHLALLSGDRAGVSFTLSHLALNYVHERHYRAAGRLLARAITLTRLLDTPYELSEYLHHHARVYFLQQAYAEADRLNREALELAQTLGDAMFIASMVGLQAQLDVALARITPATAALRLEEHLADPAIAPADAAWLHDVIWQLTGEESHRQQAAELYRTLYADSPEIRYRERYAALTGSELPPPPELPPLPAIITRQSFDLDQLLRQADALIAELERHSVAQD